MIDRRLLEYVDKGLQRVTVGPSTNSHSNSNTNVNNTTNNICDVSTSEALWQTLLGVEEDVVIIRGWLDRFGLVSLDTLVCDSQLTLRGAQRALEKPEYGLLPVLTTQEHDLLHNSIDFYRRQQDVMQTYDASESSIRKKGHVHGLRGVVLQFVERLYIREGEDADDDVAGDEIL